jgi:hypothetical protein
VIAIAYVYNLMLKSKHNLSKELFVIHLKNHFVPSQINIIISPIHEDKRRINNDIMFKSKKYVPTLLMLSFKSHGMIVHFV